MTIEAPNSGDGSGVQDWAPTEHAALVQAKGWKGVGDALTSYSELEKFRGAPADRLIMLPEKPEQIDDKFRTDLFKRINFNPSRAPATAADYGVNFEGAPPEFATGLTAIAHKHGISKEALSELAEFNEKFGKEFGEKTAAERTTADDKTVKDRHAAVGAKLKERFAGKDGEMTERMTREAIRIGFKDAAALEAYERNLALGEEGDLLLHRSLLAEIAELRRESPLHKDAGSGTVNAATAKQTLEAKGKDPEWAKKATTRGTPEAAERLRLIQVANGVDLDADAIKKLADGANELLEID